MLQHLYDAGYGNRRLSVRPSKENVINTIKLNTIDERSAETVPQESPVKESKCNGRMEEAVPSFERHIKTYDCEIGKKTGVKPHPRSRQYSFMLQ